MTHEFCSGRSLDHSGFTLIETTVALGLFLIVAVSAANLILMASRFSSGIIVKQELLENARVVMDFMTANIEMAEEITLVKKADGTLSKLSLKETNNTGTLHTYVYEYDSSLSAGSTRYHRVELGGNELASYIALIRVDIDADKETLEVYIKTDDRLLPNGEKMSEPVELTGKVKIMYKKVTVI